MCSTALAQSQVTTPSSDDVVTADRGLALLTSLVGRLLEGREALPEDLAAATRAVLGAVSPEFLGDRCRLHDPAVRRTVPPRVVESWRFFSGTLALLDDVKVAVSDVPISGEHEPIWVIYAAAGSAGGFLEAYDARGAPLCSARCLDKGKPRWDHAFGASRTGARALACRGRGRASTDKSS